MLGTHVCPQPVQSLLLVLRSSSLSEELLTTFREPSAVLGYGEVEVRLWGDRPVNNYSTLGKVSERVSPVTLLLCSASFRCFCTDSG